MLEHDVKALLESMTLDEKVGQLQQLISTFYTEDNWEITGPVAAENLDEAIVHTTGSVLGLSGAQSILDVQTRYLETSRLKIPLLFMADIVHGYQTIFPIPLGMGATWQPDLLKQAAEVAAVESSVSGLHVTFAPMVDLVRDPRWGRVMESTGEDPFLNRLYAKAQVEGYQGEDLSQNLDRIAACVKHFAAYGAPEAGREYNTVDMSERRLRQYYLPSYQAAIEAGSRLVMTAFNTVDEIPATVSQWLNRQVLREEMDFDGVLISDWAAIKEVIAHGVAGDEKQAAQLALKAGVDIEMMTFAYHRHVKELVEADPGLESLLDEAVWRILELKNELGLFENPYRNADVEKEAQLVYSDAHLETALHVAEASLVVLENKQQVLPLPSWERTAFVGTHVNTGDILGSWSWKGDVRKTETIQECLLQEGVDASRIVEIAELDALSETEFSAIEALADTVDTYVVFLGESVSMSGEASSRTDIRLPKAQRQLIEKMQSLHKKIVVVLFNGRPLDISELADQVDGLVEAWFPGSKGASAILNLLSGRALPQGRLSMSFPQNVGQVPVYYNHFNTGRPYNPDDADNKYVSKYLDVVNEPKYPFGYGLNYSEVIYQDLNADRLVSAADTHFKASVMLRNQDEHPVIETVQWYVRDCVAEVVRPVKELVAFNQVRLEPGQSMKVDVSIPLASLSYYHHDMKSRFDKGEYELMVGANSQNVSVKRFEIV